MSQPFTLVLGTHNQKKRRELEMLLSGLSMTVKTLDDFYQPLAVPETGHTFAENAALKATVQAKHLNRWVVGEDSGLSVEALNGQPGVYSSRFAGETATDEQNNQKLVALLREVPVEKRGAMYTCHVSLSDPNQTIRIDVEAYCRGKIVLEPRGTAGFGYDPHFELIEYHQTFGELGDTVKSLLSHRARAMRQFRIQLVELLKQRDAS